MPKRKIATDKQKQNLAGRLIFLRKHTHRPDSDSYILQQDVADFLGITRSNYSYYESGKTTPSIFLLIKLAGFYGISLDKLVGVDMRQNQKRRVTKNQTTKQGAVQCLKS